MKKRQKARFDHITEDYKPTGQSKIVRASKPLSVHERLLRAIRQQDVIKRLASLPGDEDFDSPDMPVTPHQLVNDPDTGQELTAGELVMLQRERFEASAAVKNELERRRRISEEARQAATKAAGKRNLLGNPKKKFEDDESGESSSED